VTGRAAKNVKNAQNVRPGHLLDDILCRLRKVSRAGDGWTALCPAHEDHNPSLSIRQTANGRVLFKCFAGCSYADIMDALRFERRDSALRPGAKGREFRPGAPADDAMRKAANAPVAAWVWSQSLPIAGTPAEVYLRARGIASLPPGAEGVLRFAPSCIHPSRAVLPAMIAAAGRWSTDGNGGVDLAESIALFFAPTARGRATLSPRRQASTRSPAQSSGYPSARQR